MSFFDIFSDITTELGSVLVDDLGGYTFTVSTALSDGARRIKSRASDGLGNHSDFSAELLYMIDTVAPWRRCWIWMAVEDSGSSSSDNVTNVAAWNFFANTPGEAGFNVTRELSPNGRDATWTFGASASSGCFCFYYPDNLGGLGVDGRQGVWRYQTYFMDLAGNQSGLSNVLAITFDSVAPLVPVLDLPAV